MLSQLLCALFIVAAVAVVIDATASEDLSHPEELRFLCGPSELLSRMWTVCQPKAGDCSFYGPTWINDHACQCGVTDAQLIVYCCPPWSNDTLEQLSHARNAMTASIRTYDNAADESDIPKLSCKDAINTRVKRVCRETKPRCAELGPADFKKRICQCGLTDNEVARYCCPDEPQRSEDISAKITGTPWY